MSPKFLQERRWLLQVALGICVAAVLLDFSRFSLTVIVRVLLVLHAQKLRYAGRSTGRVFSCPLTGTHPCGRFPSSSNRWHKLHDEHAQFIARKHQGSCLD